MIKKLALIVLLSIVLSGCLEAIWKATATTEEYQRVTEPAIGCSYEEIQISNIKEGRMLGKWEATCKGQKFFCSMALNHAVTCTPALK